jgi:hypothetical protein
MVRLVKEATEIRLNFNNFNRDGGFLLSQAWYRDEHAVARQSNQLTPPTSPSLMASVQPKAQSPERYMCNTDWFPHHFSSLRTRTEMVLETLVSSVFNHLTQLAAPESFIANIFPAFTEAIMKWYTYNR